jgi:hypothetical protein
LCASAGTHQVREYPDNHRRRLDGGNDPQVAATLRAVFEVEVKHAPEQARPAHACRCVCVFLGVFLCVFTWFVRRVRPSGKKRIHTYLLEDLSRQFASGNRCHDVCLYVWL